MRATPTKHPPRRRRCGSGSRQPDSDGATLQSEAPTQPIDALVGQWVVADDPEGVLESEHRRYDATGTSLVAFLYVDHVAGISAHVEAFCERLRDGSLRVTARPAEHRDMLKIRYSLLTEMRVAPVTSEERAALELPDVPEWLRWYAAPGPELVRRLPELSPLRAPGFPDDLKFVLMPSSKSGQRTQLKPEQLWMRTERLRRREAPNVLYVEGTLLTEPYQDVGVHLGDDVLVRIQSLPNGAVSSFCVGHRRHAAGSGKVSSLPDPRPSRVTPNVAEPTPASAGSPAAPD